MINAMGGNGGERPPERARHLSSEVRERATLRTPGTGILMSLRRTEARLDRIEVKLDGRAA